MASGDIDVGIKGQQYQFSDPTLGLYWTINPVTGVASASRIDEFDKTPTAFSGKTGDYRGDRDYGLGTGALGVIVTKRDKNGTPVQFYAMTPGGGGQFFDNLEQAKTSASSYLEWDKGKNPTKYQQTNADGTINLPTGGVTTGSAGTVWDNTKPSSSTVPTGPTGELMTPGYGEQTWEKTQKEWDQPTALEQTWNAKNGSMNQPTNAETNYKDAKAKSGPTNAQSLWDGYAKTFSSPAGLEAVYDRKFKEASTNLNRRASSAGVGDSAAAARATGGLAQKFADQTVLGMQDWAKTGGALAGAADSANLQQQGQLGSFASAADSSKLAQDRFGLDLASGATSSELQRLSARQTAANSAQTAKQNRAGQALDAATGLGSVQAGIAASGLDSAAQQKFNTDLEALKLDVQKGNISAQEAYNKSSEWLKALGVTLTAANSKGLMDLFSGNNSNWDPFANYKR